MLAALARRDVAAVFRLINKSGVSQREIAQRIGIAQSEVSEIITGERRVAGYDTLLRICQGLGIPRGLMGLAHTHGGNRNNIVAVAVGDDEDVKRRKLLAHAASVMFGEAMFGGSSFIAAIFSPTPEFGRVGLADVAALKTATEHFRAIDRQYGGAGVVTMVCAVFDRGGSLLKSAANEKVRSELAAALADLGCLCGWITNDVGLGDEARNVMMRALNFAGISGDRDIISNALRVTGRIEGHRGDPNYALSFLQIAEVDATDDLLSTIKADQAKLFAEMGLAEQARSTITAAGTGNADIASVTGEARLLLGDFEAAHADLSAATGNRDIRTARSAAIERVLLAKLAVTTGEAAGAALAHDAITAVEQLASQRTRERLGGLVSALRARGESGEYGDLAERARDVAAKWV
jgi:transcriptional regulator with XRE-family HTH domain